MMQQHDSRVIMHDDDDGKRKEKTSETRQTPAYILVIVRGDDNPHY